MNTAQATNTSEHQAHEDTVIAFPDGLPGFEACRSFLIVTSPEMEPLRQLHSVGAPSASFLGIDPRLVLPGYRCELSPTDRERLGVVDESVLLWLALIAIDEEGTVTANLRAPVVINPHTMMGRQVMPHRCLYALKHVIEKLA